ncbi:MAG: 2-amino-4-hydroxy-6-hydroxymethyldihydropteridine diphosphokinase [Bacteroidota bacterium]
MQANVVYLGLGSNIYPRIIYVYQALNLIENNIGHIISRSSIYPTAPWKMPENASFFYNLCVSVNTSLSANEVLNNILYIEKYLGRVRISENTYESRCIDIDILFFNDAIIQTEQLKIPHPLIQERLFVLEPLCEIAENLVHPVFNKTIKELKDEKIYMY